MRKLTGFSLIELLIVIAIVSILAAVALPSYYEQRERGRRADCKEFIFRISALQERFFTENISFANSLTAGFAAGGLNLPQVAGVNGAAASSNGACNLTLAVTPANCGPPDGASCTGYTLTGTMASMDARCTTLTYDNFGVKGITGNAPDPDVCWR